MFYLASSHHSSIRSQTQLVHIVKMKPTLSIVSLVLNLIGAAASLSGAAQEDALYSKLIPTNWVSANEAQVVQDLSNVDFENSAPILTSDKSTASSDKYQRSFCKLIPIIHLLHMPGCQSKAVASFACAGSCMSYVQVSL